MNNETVYSWYDLYKAGIFRFALSILRDPQLAEDVLQETFVRLLSAKRLPAPGSEQAWLYRVARNLCYDILRRKKRETEEPAAESAPPDQSWEFIELISSLNETEREIVSLKFIGGLSHQEIAKITGATVHGAKKRYERAIQKLRREMEESI